MKDPFPWREKERGTSTFKSEGTSAAVRGKVIQARVRNEVGGVVCQCRENDV